MMKIIAIAATAILSICFFSLSVIIFFSTPDEFTIIRLLLDTVQKMVTDNADATRTLNLLGVVSSICGVITTIGGVFVLFSDSFGAFFGGGSSGRR